MLSFIYVFSLVGLLGSIGSAQIIQNGQCNPDIALFQNFNIDNFLGSWYEVARTDHPLQGGDCSGLNFERVNNVINIRYEAVNRNFYEEITGTVSQEGETARLTLNLTVFSEPVDFWVLWTDHNNVALTYKCVNIGADQRAIYVWQLGRQQTFSELFLALMNTTLSNLLGITLDDLRKTDYSDEGCYELPVIEENQPIVLPGQCDPNTEVVQNLDVERFMGTWHEIFSYYSDNAVGTCARAEYTLEGSVVNVLNSQVVNQSLDTIAGTASVINADGSGKLSVVLEVAPGVFAEQELWVLTTDYTDYAVLYTCVNQENDQKRVYSWITSRTRQQTPAAQLAVTELVDSIMDLNAMYYDPTDQSDDGCFYFPEAVVNQPVVFRGQCDMSIPAMPNFDAVRYMGLWHETDSYPSMFQTGTCNNAYYTLDPVTAVVDVFNTQVIDQRLDTINGNATIADDADGTGKLVVTFPIAGTEFTVSTDYWVLNTDYENYALVYTCFNIDADTRAVWSWKLSRTKQLSAAASTAIDAVISTIPVLDNRYYQTRDQSVDGCFYFPEPQPGVPVVFPGRCDDTITAVPNFNLTAFQGVWHEIQAYPTIQQEGDCINHAFTQGTGNTLDLQSFQIVDQFLTVNNGSVAFNSTDGSARLAVNIVVGGEVIEIPYWILLTDYTNYALAYTCSQINDDFRGIWSWKLSRTKELSATSNAAVDAAIAPIEVLDNVYYEPIDQSDAACFFLPELEPGEPIVLVGQCQIDIPVVQNFDPERYQGRWRLIESYPSDFQNGSCNDATYTLQGASVLVVNTQVIDERLDTIEGSAVLATADNDGKLLVTFPGAEPLQYWILDTDYDSYALVYACVNLNSEWRRVWSWKMSRTRELSELASTNINRIISSIDVLNNRYFEKVDNSDAGCFYYPIPDGNAVIFRGQCDENIGVVNNFNVTRYLGTWNDIQSYPQAFQNGTCATATYTLTDDGVEVYNTQVIGERLDDIYGLAVLDNDDGLAKLIVTFPIFGTDLTINSPYWVLDTDYNNYALVYSCQNLDEDSRRVSSWKLSRQRTLSAASETAINTVLNSVQVLSQEYYSTRDHTDEGCFYFPEPVAGKPVVFPGQCDDTIQAEPNFNLTRFSGIWHETAAYPKDEQEGQCINYDFTTLTADSFGLYTTQVIDLLLDETNATVVRTSTDNSAKFIVTINNGSETVNIPYWIISTDYDNYALAYSCVNYGPNFRGLWSWKLSRGKQMSDASEIAITRVIADINVLDNRYFEATSQSDTSCFYLPVLGPEDPVIFPGQCDTSIPAVANFDPVRYQGRWRLVESYQSDFQTGTCIDANYELQPDSSVLVFNTQVINETLNTITGSAVLATADGTGKLLVTFPGAEPLDYWILDTDYDSYALVYTCVNLNNDQRRVWSWKLSRTTSLSESAGITIDHIVDTVNVLNDRYYSLTDHSDAACFYFPVPDSNPVVFRGQCDENISVVSNFDIPRYMGTWFDIESYPQAFQNGTCATASYTLTDDGVLVYNTQVTNQRLDNVNATAVPLADDGLAKLIVTFPIAGTDLFVESDYWVLATDYDNYALVYSCNQIDDEYRSVTSWKLSRQQQLSAASQASIDATISNVQVLSNQYYQTRGHTDDDCFYYPDNFGGPVFLNGQCEEQNVVENFDFNLFAGTWHEVARFPAHEQVGVCTVNQIEINQTSSVLTQNFVYNERLYAAAGPVSASSDGRGIFTATLTNQAGTSLEITWYVLDTDYTEYALLFICVNDNEDTKQVYSWKLSRSRSGLSQAANDKINELVTRNIDLYEGYYEYTDQTNDGCFHYPVFEEPPPAIVLPGPCNERIQAKANFDVNAYLGRWFEITKYPQRDQIGECSRAHYSEGQGVAPVDVRNTIVHNQTLETREGTADIASTDGSGLLNVTFILDNGVVATTNYYVLETDYTNFALVYSCRNLDNGDSEVYSWKLSRSPTLINEANTIIDDVINNTRGLLEEYYQPTSQSDEDCFYVPELNPDVAVLFRGQCEDLTGMAGFDMTRYVGWWHEIERYPSDGDVGECISSQYSAGSGFQVVDTSVFGLTGQVTTGTVVATANGMLTRTLSNGQTEIMWVLDTDYDTYSLLYSCTNTEDGEYRRVWSAKHSQTRSLTAAAQAAMEPIISANEVLYDQFYLPVNQSDEACFHYPEPTGERVVLPGQCDEAITTVLEFNPAKYTGTWYQIERYPYPEVSNSGSCIGARYSYNADTGVISVLNWEMIDGTLKTIEGTAEADGAKLIVTLPVEGTNETTTTDLYILHSDFVTYSLAYTCTNINEFQRAVVAFKLSRTRDLPASAVRSINTYMATREELNQDYFIDIVHENCTEPSSALLIQSSFIVMLVCIAIRMFI